jgi:hypothetical protein
MALSDMAFNFFLPLVENSCGSRQAFSPIVSGNSLRSASARRFRESDVQALSRTVSPCIARIVIKPPKIMKKNLPKQESPLSHETDLPEAITAAGGVEGQRRWAESFPFFSYLDRE